MIDELKELIEASDIVQIISEKVKLKNTGKEWVGLCPFHDEKSPSFSVNPVKKIFKCFGCGVGGDVVEFVQKHEQLDIPETKAYLKARLGVSPASAPEPKLNGTTKKRIWEVVSPVPDDAPKPDFIYMGKSPSCFWTYKNHLNQLLGYVCRFYTGKKKEIRPYVLCKSGNLVHWRWQGFPDPRPIYNIKSLVDKQTTCLVVEGEPAADAAINLFPSNPVITWMGGTNAISKSEWPDLFKGRDFILWPDNDDPGWLAMNGGEKKDNRGNLTYIKGVAEFIQEAGGNIAGIIKPDPEKPKGWDIANEKEWTSTDAAQYLKSHKVAWERPKEPPPSEPPPDLAIPIPQYSESILPFKPLGYSKTETGQNEFYIYSFKAKQVLFFRSFDTQKFMQFAPLSFWEERFETRSTRSKFDIDTATAFVHNLCYSRGVYDAANIRGRGAWMDNGKPIIHMGSHLVLLKNGHPVKVSLSEFDSRYIYEANSALDFDIESAQPLNNQEANKLIELFSLANWEKGVNAQLLCGWMVLGPVCGALNWRPHIWLTGARGTGKSTIFTWLKRIAGKIAVHIQGKSTEPGIRATLKHDARPVIFDELDKDNLPDKERIENILATVRGASSHDAGSIVKGSAGGGAATNYSIRSCFAFASISPQVSTGADKSRITVLSMIERGTSKDREKRWKEMQRIYAEITDEYCAGLQLRTIKLLPVILQNVDVFTRAAASHLGEQRAGDQLGALLAGAYSLSSSNVIKYDAALAWLQEREWSEAVSENSDEEKLFKYLTEAIVNVETSRGAKVEKQVGELIKIATTTSYGPELISRGDANDRLGQFGIAIIEKCEEIKGLDGIAFSNTSNWIMKMLRGQPWENGFYKVLERIPGAAKFKPWRYSTGSKTSRGVVVPLDYLFDD